MIDREDRDLLEILAQEYESRGYLHIAKAIRRGSLDLDDDVKCALAAMRRVCKNVDWRVAR